jgi:hypothetical protein
MKVERACRCVRTSTLPASYRDSDPETFEMAEPGAMCLIKPGAVMPHP